MAWNVSYVCEGRMPKYPYLIQYLTKSKWLDSKSLCVITRMTITLVFANVQLNVVRHSHLPSQYLNCPAVS